MRKKDKEDIEQIRKEWRDAYRPDEECKEEPEIKWWYYLLAGLALLFPPLLVFAGFAKRTKYKTSGESGPKSRGAPRN